MGKIVGFCLIWVLTASTSFCQLTGTKNIPGDYPDLATAINTLNTQGVGAGGVIINLVSGNPQTAPAGGYVIGNTGSAILTTSSATNPVVIQGNNNIITASAANPAGSTSDGIFKLIGADWITIQNFTVQENPLNTITASASNNMTEWGFALLYVTTTDGAKFNTILNNTISLRRTYINSIGVYSNVMHAPSNPGVQAPITAASGTNTNNKIYGNQINDVNAGVVFVGMDNTTSLLDNDNEIGGSTPATGNSITNWGTTQGPNAFINAAGVNGIKYYSGRNFRISNNTITSFAISTASVITGIESNYLGTSSPGGTYTITNNNIKITQNGSGGLQGIRVMSNPFAANLGALTVNITGNTLSNSFTNGGNFTCILVNTTSYATISSNKFFNNSSASTGGGFTGIQNNSEANLVTINSNEFGTAAGGAIQFTNATTGQIFGIANVGMYQMQSISISDNTFQGFSFVSSGTFTCILNTAPILNDINLNNNRFGTAIAGFATWSAANANPLTCISNSNGIASSTRVSINNNQFKGIVYAAVSSSPVTFITNIIPFSIPRIISVGINGNQFDNLTINSSGPVLFMNSSATVYPPGSSSVSNNTILTGFNKPVSGGSVIFAQITGTSSTNTSNNFNGNNFSNVTVTGTTNIIGCSNSDGSLGPLQNSNHKYLLNNIFDNIHGDAGSIEIIKSINYDQQIASNIITNISNHNSITGISFQGSPLGGGPWNVLAFVHSNRIQNLSGDGDITGIKGAFNVSPIFSNAIRQNIISDLTSAGPASVMGIVISAGNNDVYLNKIYNLTASHSNGKVSGMLISGGEINTVFNNLVGNLYAPTSNVDNAITGISVTGSNTTTLVYNTILLNASSSGSSFGSSSIYASTTPALILRNNILVNNTIPGSSGYAVAYRRSNSSLTTYGAASNNNLFYLNNPGPRNLVFYDGTNGDQSLPAFQARVAPRDAASISTSPNFISTTGSDASFLHINPVIPTPIDGGAAPFTGITTDFDLQTRNATTPDIGADEFTSGACPPATISASGPTSFCTGGSVILTASLGTTYLWSTGATTRSITVSTSGNYTVTVTLAPGCSSLSAPTVVTVSAAPPTPVITPSGPTTFCQGGSVTLSAPAGFNYLWSNGATTQNISVTNGGNYTVRITNANGCSAISVVTTVTVNQIPPIPTITANGPVTFCQGSSVTLTSSASTGYLWSTGATSQSIIVSSAGNYSVTVANANSCTAVSNPFMVAVNTRPPTPVISASGPVTFCQGGSVTLTSSSASGNLWSTGATTQSIIVTTSGNYAVTVTNASGCTSSSASTTVVVNPNPPIPVITQLGNVLTSTPAAGYQWYLSGSLIPGATSQSFTFSTPGDYTVTVTNAQGCPASSLSYTAGRFNYIVFENNERFHFNIYPNPVAGPELTIIYQLEQSHNIRIRLLDMFGRPIIVQPLMNRTPGIYRINLNDLIFRVAAGTYVVEFMIDNERITRYIIKLRH